MVFQLLISLDFTSHYMHMYATLAMGGKGESHKNVDEKRSKIMHLYYSNRVSREYSSTIRPNGQPKMGIE